MALAPVRICVPRNRIATQASEFATNVSGAQFAAWNFDGADFVENQLNTVSISFDPRSFDQFTLSDPDPTFVARLTTGEFQILAEQANPTFRWGYANTLNFNDGVVIASGPISRDALLLETTETELLFDSTVDWVDGATTQTLRSGSRFDSADTIVIFYHLSNPNANKRDWTVLRANVAPLLTGGFSNNAIQTVSDTSFNLTTGANAILSATAIEANPATQAFVIYAG